MEILSSCILQLMLPVRQQESHGQSYSRENSETVCVYGAVMKKEVIDFSNKFQQQLVMLLSLAMV